MKFALQLLKFALATVAVVQQQMKDIFTSQ